jgi:outer membrane receptor protein involved in Fe transport
VRKDVSENLYLRSAAYAGFRAPTLNELYRPFRLANNITEANPGLEPEKLYGVEVGLGGASGAFSWDATVFWNKLQNAITNVTLAQGPGNFPGVGALPAGGFLIQRQNAGDITAPGVEADAQWRLDETLALTGGLSLTDAHVDGGTAAPQLTGKRPSEAPRWTVTGGVVSTPVERVTLSAQFRYESARFADDQNTLRLGSAFTIDAKAQWNFTPQLAVYIAADNLLDAKVAANESANLITNLDAPRIVRIGITYAQ